MSLPPPDRLHILFAHAAYQFMPAFEALGLPARAVAVSDATGLSNHIGDAHVLVVSGLWRNELLAKAPHLAYVQSISAGTDQYDRQAFARANVRLASARGVNASAVAEHGIALMLQFQRQLHTLRDHQRVSHWRPMISAIGEREDELGGKTLLIVGLGAIGERLARLAKAFDMHVIATRQSPDSGAGPADEVHATSQLPALLPRADVVALTCALTPATERLIGAEQLAAMKPGAHLVNLARGRVVDEPALIAALREGRLAGASLDVTVEEPLPAASALWTMPNVVITPHSAGETRRYEDRVCAILADNLARLWCGETSLLNQVV